jgi:hypothetical protein
MQRIIKPEGHILYITDKLNPFSPVQSGWLQLWTSRNKRPACSDRDSNRLRWVWNGIDGKYLFGNYQQFSSENIWEFVTGFGWLVYNGSVVVGPGEDEKKSPRTIVGLDNDSNLISVVIDGCERW